MTEPQGDTDFFISYRGAQAGWARWVNWVVRTAGFTTVLMDEFQVGTTWTNNMRAAAERCRRLIPLYSGDYWQSGACIEEFDAYWRQHMKLAAARFILPLEIEACTVPDIHQPLLWKPIHPLTRDEARAAIVKVLEGITPVATAAIPFTEAEPTFPGSPSTPAAVIDWPDSVDSLKWPLADHDDARLAFAELVTRTASFKLLAIKGSSETGKSHLTEQFFNNARRRVTGCHCGRFDFKGTDQLDSALATFVEHLAIPLPPPAATLGDRFRHILLSLLQRSHPSLLIFDTYEDAGDADRWVRDSLLTSLHRHSWLRVVIAGQEVPSCHGKSWEEDSKVLPLTAPDPDHWMAYAKTNNKTISAATLEEVHTLTGGKASILAKLCGQPT